jgi:pilus assembly protein FimV
VTTASSPSAAAASQPTDAATNPPSAAASKPAAPSIPAQETGFVDDLLENPLVLPLAAGLLALLAGLGIYSYRKRKGSSQVDSSFLESRLQPDSFFGASGGHRIDTNEVSASGSSLVYSPSQLDAAGDVDPVAEADVYLAYGRDLQAEEILKEALRTAPTRVAIHAKLAEIYAKRRDSKGFEAIAVEAFNLTQGNGPEWAYVTEMGRELDALNPLYKAGPLPGVAPVGAGHSVSSGAPSVAASAGAAGAGFPAFSTSPSVAGPASNPGVDVDLDLDFPLGGMQDGHTSPAPIAVLSTPGPVRAPVLDKLDMDFSDISSKPIALTYPVPFSRAKGAGLQPNGTGAAPVKASPAAAPAPAAPAAALPDSGMLEFDLDSLSLDLNGPNTQSDGNSAQSEEDPLQTKFLLAEEFRSLGDADGARSLAEEVLVEARGPLKVKAQAFLNSLV